MATFTWILPEVSAASTPATSGSSVVEPAIAIFGLLDQEIDPETRDYVYDSDGSWNEIQFSRTAVMMQLEIRYGEWFVDPDAGSRIPAMLESGDPVTAGEVLDETRRALQLLVEDGIISDLEVAIGAFDPDAGRLEVAIFYTDLFSGSAVELVYNPL